MMTMTEESRTHDLFYSLLDELKNRVGGYLFLEKCSGRMNWPKRGMYFFFEEGEKRQNSNELRVTRVGTHAISSGSSSTLWQRLRTHRGSLEGSKAGGGGHRGSIFRLHVGTAILRKDNLEENYPFWGVGSSANQEITRTEHRIEKLVSAYIGRMPFLWLKVDDEPSKQSKRAYLERNCIVLLSNYDKKFRKLIDQPSENWLGNYCRNEYVRESGLWNVNHVTEKKNHEAFMEIFKDAIFNM